MSSRAPRVTVLVNPTAGKGRAVAACEAAVSRLRALGAEVRVVSGASAAETRELAAAALNPADRPDALVVVGGDGTLSTILDEVCESDVPVALVPAGTGNDLARALGLPFEGADSAALAAELVFTGEPLALDIGTAACPDGEKRFLTVAALGFDAHVSERTNRLRWPHGKLRYYLALVIELARLRPMNFTVSLDGDRAAQRPGILSAIGNTRSYGGGMPICPNADHRDGLLDMTHIAPIGRFKLLRLFPRLLSARHLERDEVSTARAASFEISAPGLVVYADGERVGTSSVKLGVLHGALRVFAPAEAAEAPAESAESATSAKREDRS